MKLQTLSLIIVALLLTACGKQSSNKSGTRINKYNGSIAGQGTSTCNAQYWGQISSNVGEEAFRQTVADFALYNLEEIGSVNPVSGVQFQMTLAFQGGQMVPSQSKAGFKITDSFVGAASPDGTTVQPIQFVMNGMSGQMDQNGRFVAYIGDSKGYIKLDGNRSGQGYTGQVSYSNYNQAERILGNFSIQACAVASY